MAVNVYTPVPTADEIQFYARNYTRASALTDMPILSYIIFTDLKVLGFTDHTGTVKKVLVDASGASATPQYRVWFANADGEATSDSDFYFDGSELYVQSEQVHHGTSSVGDTITLTNGAYTATISLSAGGVLSINIDGIEQVNWSNGGPE